MAHGWSGVADEEEEHAAPSHYVEDVGGSQEAKLCADERPIDFQPHGRCHADELLAFGLMAIAFSISAVQMRFRARCRAQC